jgi:DNA-binding transcriptional LysR family regulator
MPTMKRVHLAGVDLNLLVVLRELLRTKSTTRAARRLGRTQSAVSHALARLRALLDDPLFVRSGAGLRPTSFAEGIEASVGDLLARAEAVFSGGVAGGVAGLDPRALARTFAISTTDYAEVLILPPLLARLRREAPLVDLVMSFYGDDVERAIQAREADLSFGTRFRAVSGIVEEPAGDQEMRVVVRKGHPATRGKLDAARFASFDHALVAPRGFPGGVVDAALEALGLRRRVVLRLPHFVAAAFVVAGSDLVVTLPRSFAEHMARQTPLSVLPVPVALAPFRFVVAYSTTVVADPAHAWFRGVFLEVARAVLGATTTRPRRARAA